MNRKDFEAAAQIVRDISRGAWTNSPPTWAVSERMDMHDPNDYTRAVQTAEAFVQLFTSQSNTFQRNRFLIACGLLAKPGRQGTL